MTADIELEEISPGRICLIRLKPNQDLTEGLEAACRDAGVSRAILHAGIGSLNDAHFSLGERELVLKGPGLEILSLTGEVANDRHGRPHATLSGVVCSSTGELAGGQFQRGKNIICITAELSLQELLETGPDRGRLNKER